MCLDVVYNPAVLIETYRSCYNLKVNVDKIYRPVSDLLNCCDKGFCGTDKCGGTCKD
ncbi:MAG: hypothetical protein K0B07_04080 [DPANN group archaeon]|nr:hypothetical protein [DPANN group archaeon]